MTRSLFTKFRAFRSDREGTVAMVFSLSFLPMILFTGFAIDYGRAITVGARVQSALDATLLDAVAETSNVQVSRATTILSGTLAGAPFTIASQGFTVNADGSLSGSVTVNLPMTVMSIVTPSISITRSGSEAPASPGSAGTAGATENSCIFTMGEDLEVSNDTMTFNGSPNVNLTGCTLRSNKSMKCNGGATGAQTYAVGSIVGCSYPHSGQPVTPDVYASVASNISKVCGANAGGYAWTANGSLPAAVANTVIPVSRSGYAEIHVCGDLTLNGDASQTLTGSAPATDTVVVVENGKVQLADSAYILGRQVTFVLAGGAYSNIVNFPNGNGKTATLDISGSMFSGNPWQGMALYQNPSQTSGVDTTWKPGSFVKLSGVIYFPNASLTVQGNISMGPTDCAKIVSGEFTLNGSVNLKQTNAGCSGAGVAQYTFPGTSGVAATQSRILY